MEEPQKLNRAWLLDFGRGLQAAVGIHEMSHVLLETRLYEIPRAPYYCAEVLVFERMILPVMDVISLIEQQRIVREGHDVIGIAVYQEATTGDLNYAAMHLATMPTLLFVDNRDACELPQHLAYWQPYAWSCFLYEEKPIPIIDFTRLYAPEDTR
jgi:hypothetical protein